MSTYDYKENIRRRSKRLILSEDQIEMLTQEYLDNPNWSNETIDALSRRVGVSRTKVYKWNWDRKKKE